MEYELSDDDREVLAIKLNMILDDIVSPHVKYNIEDIILMREGEVAIGKVSFNHERGEFSMNFSITTKKIMSYGDKQ